VQIKSFEQMLYEQSVGADELIIVLHQIAAGRINKHDTQRIADQIFPHLQELSQLEGLLLAATLYRNLLRGADAFMKQGDPSLS
jgi:hypothetical protein